MSLTILNCFKLLGTCESWLAYAVNFGLFKLQEYLEVNLSFKLLAGSFTARRQSQTDLLCWHKDIRFNFFFSLSSDIEYCIVETSAWLTRSSLTEEKTSLSYFNECINLACNEYWFKLYILLAVVMFMNQGPNYHCITLMSSNVCCTLYLTVVPQCSISHKVGFLCS